MQRQKYAVTTAETKHEKRSLARSKVCPNCGGKLVQFMVGLDIDTVQCVKNDAVRARLVFNDPNRKFKWVLASFPRKGETYEQFKQRYECFGFDL